MKFYTFNQNNSGGRFDENLGQFVIIEAASKDEANDKAESIGIYFNGVVNGEDCPCCGDRWYPADDWDAGDTPLIYGKSPEDIIEEGELYFLKKITVYYANGSIDTYRPQEEKE